MAKFELTREKLIVIILVGSAIIALCVYLVFYAPLIRRLKTEHLKCKLLENEVAVTKDIINVARKVYKERVLMAEKDIPQVMDELTKHGKLKGVNFISISPERINIKKEKGFQYKILPVKIRIKSKYNELATFLGSLDELQKGLVKVKFFNILPETEDPLTLITDLILDIYFSGKEHAE